MRRTLSYGTLVLFCLTSCVRHGPLASDEVLRRAAQQVQALNSAHVAGTVTMHSSEANIEKSVVLTADGVLQNGGKQLSLGIDIKASTSGSDGKSVVSHVDVIVMSPSETYLRLMSFDATPKSADLTTELDPLLGKWWRLQDPKAAAHTQDVSPDPVLLRAQSQVLAVTNDLGLTRIAGSDAYHYTIGIDPVRLEAFLKAQAAAQGKTASPSTIAALSAMLTGATGEISIDAETFFIRALTWSIPHMGSGPVSLELSLDTYNAAPAVVPPESAEPLDPRILSGLSFAGLAPATLPEESGPPSGQMLPPVSPP